MIEENSTHDRLQTLPPRYPFQTEDTWISYIPVLEVWSCNWGKAIFKQPLLMCGDVGTVKWQWSWSWITWQFIWERLTQKTILQHATCMREPDPNLKIVPSLELETEDSASLFATSTSEETYLWQNPRMRILTWSDMSSSTVLILKREN